MDNDFYKNFGALIFWLIIFLVTSVIRLFAFDDAEFWLLIPLELSIWSTGILFTIASSEETYRNARLISSTTVDASKKTVTTGYDVKMPTKHGFDPKFLFLFLFSIAVWIICVVLHEYIPKKYINAENEATGGIGWIILYFVSSVVITVSAIYTTIQVNKQ